MNGQTGPVEIGIRWPAALPRTGIWGLVALSGCAIAGIATAVAGPAFAVVLVVAALGAIAFAHLPGTLFAAYLLVPFYKGAVQPYSPIDISVLLAVANALQFIPLILDRRRPDVSRTAIVLWVALACLVLFGVLYAPDQGLAMSRATNYWALVFLPLLPAALRVGSDPRFVRQMLWTFFGMGVLTVVLGLAQMTGSRRLVVLNMNTIQTARVALLAPILAIAFVWRERWRSLRIVAIALVPAAILVAVASGARGPVLALVVLAAVTVARRLLEPRSVDWRLTGVLAGLAVASILILSVAVADLPAVSTERMTGIGNLVESSLSGATDATAGESRLRLYGLGISLFEDQPILGAGTSGFEALSRRVLGPLDAAAYPHNAMIQFGAEYGLVGIALFATIVLLALIRKLPPGSTWSALRVVFLFFLLNAMVSGNIFDDRTLWGLLLLLLFADVPESVEAPRPLAGAATHRPAEAGI
jgi:O-antigen ligase